MIGKIPVKPKKEALEVFEIFSKKPFSEHIATPIAIESLLQILEREKPQRVLEIGGGIGTLSFAVLKNSQAKIDIFEDYPACISELKENLKGFEDRYRLITDYSGFQVPEKSYDLVITDGGPNDFLRRMVNGLENVKVIFTEGWRDEQRKIIRQELKKNYAFSVRQYYDPEKKFKGAFEVICRPAGAFARFVSYWFWEILIFEEIARSLRYRTLVLLGIKKHKQKTT